jgi:hypothetical protein
LLGGLLAYFKLTGMLAPTRLKAWRWPEVAYAKARGATIRRDLIYVAARTARHGRGQITLHLPEDWHCQHEWANLFENTCGPPAQAA